jgi:hypothetical protein
MPNSPGYADLLRRRLHAQWLANRPAAGTADVVAHTTGLQAQDTSAAQLAVRARSTGTTASGVRRACGQERSVVRTWLMRGTLHMVRSADVRWLLGLFGARNAAAGTRRRRELGLDDEICAAALVEVPRILAAESPLSRADLVGRLNQRRVPINPRGQAPAHLAGYAAACGLICRGPDLDGDEPGYVLLDEWVPPGPVLDGDAALAELARRYVGAYGPAAATDLAAWAGLPAGVARQSFALIADDLVGYGADTWVLSAATEPAERTEPTVRLLGAFDTYLLGYRSRQPALDLRYAKRIQAGGGIIHPAVLVDGQVVGTWRLRRRKDSAAVTVQPFEPLDAALLPALAAEVADLARFLAIDIEPAEIGTA